MYYNANMKIQYRKINKNDKNELLDMMRIFYSSNALYTNGSEEIFNSNFENALNNTQYLECYFIVSLENVLGYVLLAKSYSTEFGRECIWLEDLYLKEQYRGKGIIPDFISYIKNKATYEDENTKNYYNNIFNELILKLNIAKNTNEFLFVNFV